MATNEYGLDIDYQKKNLEIILRDISRYTPDELARALARLAKTADEKVLAEPEFRTDNITASFVSYLPNRYWDSYLQQHPTDNKIAGSAFIRTFCDFVAGNIKSKV